MNATPARRAGVVRDLTVPRWFTPASSSVKPTKTVKRTNETKARYLFPFIKRTASVEKAARDPAHLFNSALSPDKSFPAAAPASIAAGTAAPNHKGGSRGIGVYPVMEVGAKLKSASVKIKRPV